MNYQFCSSKHVNPLKFTDQSGYNFQVYDSNCGCFRDENAYTGFAGWYNWYMKVSENKEATVYGPEHRVIASGPVGDFLGQGWKFTVYGKELIKETYGVEPEFHNGKWGYYAEHTYSPNVPKFGGSNTTATGRTFVPFYREKSMGGAGGSWDSKNRYPDIGFCGQCHNPNGHLYNDPGIVEMRKTRLIPDLISVDVNLGSTFVAGASMTYSINFVTRGEPGIYLTRTEQERFGLEVDWGFNANIAYYNGDPANINKQLLAGPINSISGGYIYGGQVFWSSERGQNIWKGIGTGAGFQFGGSYGKGRTYLGWN